MRRLQKLPHLQLTLIVLLAVVGLLLFRTLSRNRTNETVTDAQGEDIPIIQDVPKDAIPPIDNPKYIPVSDADYLNDDDIVLGVEFGGDARAYPVTILNWHEIINETIGGQEVVVTYCPLCRSGIVFDRNLEEQLLTFGNTGALFESAMVMYDRQTQSYWHQASARAIKGPLQDKELTILPSLLTRWKQWRQLHPDSQVLSRDTGFIRDYDIDNYIGYDQLNSQPAFPVSHTDNRLPPKEKIVGIRVNDTAKAYPVQRLAGKTIQDQVNGQTVEVVGEETGIAAQVFFIENGKRVPAPVVAEFWFSWTTSHPDTLIYRE